MLVMRMRRLLESGVDGTMAADDTSSQKQRDVAQSCRQICWQTVLRADGTAGRRYCGQTVLRADDTAGRRYCGQTVLRADGTAGRRYLFFKDDTTVTRFNWIMLCRFENIF